MKTAPKKLLAQHEVSQTQYLLWAERRFRRLAFWSGIGFGALFTVPLLWAAGTAYRAGDLQEFWGMIAGALFVGLLFFLGALRVGRTSGASRGFEALDVGRRTSLAYMEGLRPRHWDAVRAIDVAAWEAREAVRMARAESTISAARRDSLTTIKMRARRIGLWCSAAVLVAAVSAPFLMDRVTTDSWPGVVIVWALGTLFVAAAVGMHGWLCLYGYLGLVERKIRLYGEFTSDDSDHEGRTAVILGSLVMGVAVLSVALSMVIPIALLFGLE